MYRDDATALDEHDRAVGAILIGETLVAQCERNADRISNAVRMESAERWRAVRDLDDDYRELWRQLDRAKQVLENRGANTMSYEELRPHVQPALAISRDKQMIKAEALDDARRAIEHLKLAVPGADWKGIDKRTHDLVDLPELRRRHRLIVATFLGVVAAFVAGYLVTLSKDAPPDPAVVMRRELNGIANERKITIETLRVVLADRCDPPLAHEYVKALAMDGRKDDAMAFADGYTGRCGEDRVVMNWANAPRVRR